MAFNIFVVVSALALCVQTITAQLNFNNRVGCSTYGTNINSCRNSPSNFIGVVTPFNNFGNPDNSRISGLTIISENVIEGPVVVKGELPFIATVAVEGAVPSDGTASVAYGCGESVGISNTGGNVNANAGVSGCYAGPRYAYV